MSAKDKRKNDRIPSFLRVMKEAGLNPQKELLSLVGSNALLLASAIVSYVIAKSALAAGGLLLLAAVFDFYFLSRAKRLKKEKDERAEEEFVHVFSFFSVYLQNGIPVYSSLESSLAYASDDMGDKIKKLLKGIDDDKSVQPYLAFAQNFASLEIRQVMIAVFRMSEEGGSEAYIRQFQSLFAVLANQKRKEGVAKAKNRLETLGFLPLVASALAMGMILIGIVNLVGGLVNGL